MDFILSYNNDEGVMVFPVIRNGSVTLGRTQNNPVFDGVAGQMQALGKTELATFTVESIFPLHPYPWIKSWSWGHQGWRYVNTINAVRARRIPFRAIYQDSGARQIINLPVSVESFEYGLDRAGDIAFKLEFREYRFAKTPKVASLPQQASAAGTAVKATGTAQTASQAAAATTTDGFARKYTKTDAVMMAKVMFCESRGIRSKTEIACVGWTILNRVDAGYGTIYQVITKPNQFAYRAGASTTSDYGYDLVALATDVLDRWSREKAGQTSVGRVLPRGYLWYAGDGSHNYFRNKYKGGTRWNYSLPSPYDS